MSYKWWLLIAVGLFGIGMVLGLAMPEEFTNLFAQDLAALGELGKILGPFKITTAVFIFFKNVLALIVSFLFSPILCLAPVLALLANGFIISFVSALVIQKESLGLLLAALLPHGIFELPALIMGEAAALSFGTTALLALISKERRSRVTSNLRQNLRYLIIAFLLLLPAAIIETYITPLFIT